MDYELGRPLLKYPLPSLNRSQAEVYKMLLNDALDNHWIQLYNSTIYKNFGLFRAFYTKTDGIEFQTAGDYIRTYNFFIQHQLVTVQPVRFNKACAGKSLI